jgi:ABC-2 type transport system ATP-binding protein
MTPVIETSGLTKRYRRVTALSDCTISVPEGRVSALVGPNGAGKTTLLRLLAGLAAPTGGRAEVLGGPPREDPAYLAEIGFLAQEIPLYRRLTAEDHIGIGAHLNPRWDGQLVQERLACLKIPLDRRDLIADIERTCDHLILLAESQVQLCGDIETLLAQHRILTGPRKDSTAIAATQTVVREDTTPRQTTLLVRLNGPVIDPAWTVDEPNLEEIVLGYMRAGQAGHGAGPAGARLSAIGGGR